MPAATTDTRRGHEGWAAPRAAARAQARLPLRRRPGSPRSAQSPAAPRGCGSPSGTGGSGTRDFPTCTEEGAAAPPPVRRRRGEGERRRSRRGAGQAPSHLLERGCDRLGRWGGPSWGRQRAHPPSPAGQVSRAGPPARCAFPALPRHRAAANLPRGAGGGAGSGSGRAGGGAAARPDHGPGPARLLLPAQRQRPSAAPPAPRLGMSAGEARPRGGREAGSATDAPASAQPPAFKEAALFFFLFFPPFLPTPPRHPLPASSPSPPSAPHLFPLFAPTCQALCSPRGLVAGGGRAGAGSRRRRGAALRGQRACSALSPNSPGRGAFKGAVPLQPSPPVCAGGGSAAGVCPGRRREAKRSRGARPCERRGARAEARSCPGGSARSDRPGAAHGDGEVVKWAQSKLPVLLGWLTAFDSSMRGVCN